MTDTTQHDPSKPIACAFCGAISMTVPIKPTHTQELQKQLRELDDEGYQPSTGAIGNKAADALASSDEELARLREQLEVERMRLVACGVVAMANTPESAAKNRQMKDEYRSGSLDDVIHIVDSEMALREQVLAQQARIAQMRDGLLHYSDIRPDTLGRTVVLSDEGAIARNALATTDDLSALKAHDDALWGKALTRGIELQAKLDKIYTTEPVAFMTIDKAPYLYRDANPISSDYPIEKLIIKPTKEPA